ncbi:MAG: DUF1501 domain-containing protein [Fuerstiella sp.]|nr:DUF1501 domain-containing protein [Fuerstiella sp.]
MNWLLRGGVSSQQHRSVRTRLSIHSAGAQQQQYFRRSIGRRRVGQRPKTVAGTRARAAFDIQAEADTLRDSYGRNSTGQSLLMARRLVEAGVTCVTVRVTGWDDHTKLARGLRQRGPAYDRGMWVTTNIRIRCMTSR